MTSDQSLSGLFHSPPLTIDANHGIEEALQIMTERRISCLLVRQPGGGDICGIVTEKDLVRSYSGVAHHACKRVSDIMATQLLTVPASMGHLEAYRLMMERRIRHLPVTDADGKIIGIITESDYVRSLGADYYVRMKDVASVMAPVTLMGPGDSLRQALGLLSRSDVTCVVVVVENSGGDQDRLGILTERDVVRLLRKDVDADQSRLSEVMTSPVVTVSRDATLFDASEILAERRIRRVVVVDGDGHPVGILSQHEIVKGLENEYIGHLEGVIVEKNRALSELSDARQGLETQSQLLRRMLDELSVAHSELREFTKIAAHDLQEPLRRIMTYGQMLGRHLGEEMDEEGAGYLKIMMDQSDRARQLVQGLVGYSASMISLERLEIISTADAVQGALALLHTEIERYGAEIFGLGQIAGGASQPGHAGGDFQLPDRQCHQVPTPRSCPKDRGQLLGGARGLAFHGLGQWHRHRGSLSGDHLRSVFPSASGGGLPRQRRRVGHLPASGRIGRWAGLGRILCWTRQSFPRHLGPCCCIG